MLPSQLRPGLPTSFFSSGLPTTILFVIGIILTGATFPPLPYPSRFVRPNYTDSQYKLSNSTLCTFSFSHFIFLFLGNIILFSNHSFQTLHEQSIGNFQ
jgi:hypothetical protein